MFAISVCFPKVITCMGVAVSCANQTASLVALNVPVLPLFSKLSNCECPTLLFWKDASPH